MTEITLPISVLATMFGEDEQALKEALFTAGEEEGSETQNSDAADFLLTKNAERLAKLRQGKDAEIARKAEKARKEAEATYQAEMQALRTELESAKAKGPGGAESDADRLKREEETARKIEAVKAEYAAELEKERGRFKQGETNARAIKAGMEYFDGMRPILGESPSVAAQRRADFESLLRQRDYSEPIGGRFVVQQDGESAKDEHENLLTLEKWVEGLARPRFEFQKQEQKGNGGNQNGSAGAPVGVPKTEEEFNRRYFEETDPEKRIALKDAWEAKNKSN